MRRGLVLLLLLATAAQAKPDAEQKLKAKLAKVWIDCARVLKVSGHKAKAQEALARARAADENAKDLERLTAEVEALPDGSEGDGGAAWKKAAREAAKTCDKLAKLGSEDYLFRAIELDPSKSRIGRVVARIRKEAGNKGKDPVAARLLVRLRAVHTDGKYDALETELARKDLALVRGKGHEMVGYLSLPKGWKSGRSYRVLVAVEGAGCNFVGAARRFARERGSRDFLVLTPCGFSNTNELNAKKYPFYSPAILEEHGTDRIRFDLEGLRALLETLQERFGAKSRIGITGFSGGGNLCYGFTAVHPDRILFAAPACPNFSGQGFRDAEPVTGGGPPVHIFTGEKDQHREFTFGNKNSPGIEPQTDNAVKALAGLGFKNVQRTMLKGVGHSNCARQVWEFADEIAGR